MPKQVDYEQRRRQLADALWRLTRREGWEAISIRKVAAEAGVSVGMVQHAFTTSDQMLAFAVQLIIDEVRSRIQARIAELPQPLSPQRIITVALTEMIPDPDRNPDELPAAAVFIRRYLLNADTAAQMSAGNPDLRPVLVEQLTAGGCADAELEADSLLALLDGLFYGIVSRQLDARRAVQIMETRIAKAF